MKNKNPFIPLLLTIFIDLLGVGIVIPVLAPLFLDPINGLLSFKDIKDFGTLYIGFLSATYPIAQFFGAPILGSLSDRKGRKPILIISLIGTFVGYALFVAGILTKNIPLLFLGRAIDGFTGGNITIAYSAIADITKESDRAKNFGLIGMAFGLGFILGPYIGGKLADPTIVEWFRYWTPFAFAGLLTLINIISVFTQFPETLKERINKKLSLFTGVNNLVKALSMESLRNLFLTSFLLTFGFNFFTQFFQVYLIDKFAFTQSQIGDLFAYMGLFIAITQGGLLRVVGKKFKSDVILKVSVILLSLSFVLLLLPNKSIFIYFLIPLVAIFQGFTQPNITALISNSGSEHAQGDILGGSQSITALAQAIPPIISGFIVTININLPITVAAIFTFFAWITILFFKKKDEKFEE